MILWVDAQLSPALAPWIAEQFGIQSYSVRWLGYRDAEDPEIFRAAREAGAVVLTKDSDFVRLLEQHGPPPQVLLVTLGNTSNARRAWTHLSSSRLAAGEWRATRRDRRAVGAVRPSGPTLRCRRCGAVHLFSCGACPSIAAPVECSARPRTPEL